MAIQTFYSAHTAQTIDNGITLIKVTENFKEGLRLLRENPANHGNIGANAIDLTHSTLISNHGATGDYSISTGYNTISNNDYEFVFGKYNKGISGTIFEAGIGLSNINRLNALEIYEDGSIIAPQLSISLIDSDNKSLITREYLSTLSITGSYSTMSFTATNGQTNFVIFSEVFDTAGVYLNGIRVKETDYSITDDGTNTTITFNNGLVTNDIVLIDFVKSNRTIYNFTATDNQTTFLITNEVFTRCGVYTEGIRNKETDYVLTNNGTDTTVTFNIGRVENAWILIDIKG